jgi:hypothetical protein
MTSDNELREKKKFYALKPLLMGINGLLPKLSSIFTQVHLQELANLTVGVDAYVWLHRGAYSCSSELCQGIPTTKYGKVLLF